MIGRIRLLIIKYILKGDVIMMVMFYAQRVINGKSNFAATEKTDPMYIPPSLRQAVADTLLESGIDWLVPAEYGGTA